MMEWLDVAFAQDELERRARFHPSKTVDVALVDITDRFTAELKAGQPLAAPYFLGADQQAGQNNIKVEVGDDILVAGYPRGFYDDVNLFSYCESRSHRVQMGRVLSGTALLPYRCEAVSWIVRKRRGFQTD